MSTDLLSERVCMQGNVVFGPGASTCVGRAGEESWAGSIWNTKIFLLAMGGPGILGKRIQDERNPSGSESRIEARAAF